MEQLKKETKGKKNKKRAEQLEKER